MKRSEAIEVLKKYQYDPEVQEALECLHPELKESYDERIRKELFEFINGFCAEDNHPFTLQQADRWLAWLEKQGSQNLANSAKTCKDEQKPTDNIESSAFKDKLLELFQKFRWIKKGVPTNGDIIEYVDAHIQELINTIQNPAWSDEDEEHIKSLLKRLEGLCCKEFATTRFAISEDEDWLKSLKERYTWKPSDEQMEYLAKAITTLGNEGDNKTSARLCELRTDLKKLKG